MTKHTNTNDAGNNGKAFKTLFWTGAAVGAAAVANAAIFYKTLPLTSKLSGEVRYFPTPDGDVFYKKTGEGPPLLLVHGVGAGCSSFEFRNVWERLAEKHTVYALDLLGFGKSDKPSLTYTDGTYINLLEEFARHVLGVGNNKGEADVIATSLSAAFVIALSRRDPTLFRRLVLIEPTGIEELAAPISATKAFARALLKTPVLGTSFYNAVASRKYIRAYLEKHVYADPDRVTDEIVEQYHTAAHQPGGENVLPSFLSGYLNVNVADAFPEIEDLPLLVWGRGATMTPLSQAEAFLSRNPHAKLEVIEDAGALPHEEQPDAFLAAVRPFLAGAATGEDDADDADDDVAAPTAEAALSAT